LKSNASQQFIRFFAGLASAAMFCGVASAIDPPSDADGNQDTEKEAGEYPAADPVPRQCAEQIVRTFAKDDKGDSGGGQRRLDTILNKYGYPAGSLNYESDNLKRVAEVEKKLRRKKHKTRSSPPPEEPARASGDEFYFFK
jgi:hypothetical protein